MDMKSERAWYAVQTYSGFESAAKRNIENRVVSMGMSDVIFNVLVPEITRMEKNKKGEPKEVVEKPYPGYVFIDMIVTDESWFMVRNTPSVTGFLGSSGGGAKPVPIPEDEMGQVLKMCGISIEKKFDGVVGGTVRINTGSFSGQEGIIDAIDTQKGTVKVSVYVFGRPSTTEFAFEEVTVL